MARGWHYTKLSLSSALLLSFFWQVYFVIAPFFLPFSVSFRYVGAFFVDVPLTFSCPADHVPDCQPRILLGMVEARSVNVKKRTITTLENCFIKQSENLKYRTTENEYHLGTGKNTSQR